MAEKDNGSKLAYVIGALYGDGCFAHKDIKGRIHFGSSDIEFVNIMANFINDIFGLTISVRVDRLSAKNKKWKDFYSFSSRKLYKNVGKYDWKLTKKIPNFVKCGKSEVKAAFIRGFFDAEGSVDLHSFKRKDGRVQTIRHVKCFSNDTELLKEVKLLLTSFKIDSKVFHSKNPNYCLVIWNNRSLRIYQNAMGFNLERKSIALKKAIESYKQIQTRWNLEDYENVMTLRKQGLGALKIKRRLSSSNNIPLPTIESWIYHGGKPLKQGV